MATEVRHRRGTTAQHVSFTGAQGEVTVDTDKKVVVVHDGVTPGGFPSVSSVSVTSKADILEIQKNSYVSGIAGGTANVITLTLTPAITSYVNGMEFEFKPTATNTIAGVTLNINGLGAKTIVKRDNVALVSDDIDGVGHWVTVTYDGTLDKFILKNPKFGEIPDAYLTADAAGRAKMADGFVDFLKIAAGAVVQVVGQFSAGGSTFSGTYGNVTSLAITPKSATNKVIVFCSWSGNIAASAGVNALHQVQILRGASVLSGNISTGAEVAAGGVGASAPGCFIKLDSPATTSATTYFLQHRTTNATAQASTANVDMVLVEVKA